MISDLSKANGVHVYANAKRKLETAFRDLQLTSSEGLVAADVTEHGVLRYVPVIILSDADARHAFAIASRGVYAMKV